jgi:putative cardiolipin synthase
MPLTGCFYHAAPIRYKTMTNFRLCILVLLLFIYSCASLPADFERPVSHMDTATSQTRLGRNIEPLVARHAGQSGFLMLPEGLGAFAVRLSLVHNAQKTLDIQYYIWHDDQTGNILFKEILKAADRGVRVRLMLDDFHTTGKEKTLALLNAHANIEVRLFNPFAYRSFRFIDYVTRLHRINYRMHNKSLTADNQATVFGGRNIGDEYFDADGYLGFSDMDVLAIGPVVTEVSASFDLYWNSQWLYPLTALDNTTVVDDAAMDAFRQSSVASVELVRASGYAQALQKLLLSAPPKVEDYDFLWGPWKLVYDQPGKVDAKKVSRKTHLAPTLKAAMDDAGNELIIVSPYFVPGPEFTDYLTGLVKSGKRVRVMTNSLAANDVSLVHAGYMRYRKKLVEGGVELYEFKATKEPAEESSKSKTRWTGSSQASLHGKFLGFDRRYLFVGSFNMDNRSVAINTELGVFFESPYYAGLLADSFDQRAQTQAYRVSLDKDGDLLWSTLENGGLVYFDVEPETGFWRRWSTRFLSVFVPESQL